MQYKKFTAPDMREALAQIKADLGADAVIVATRQLDGGLFRRPLLEVTAGLAAAPPAVNERAAAAAYGAPPPAAPRAAAPEATAIEQEIGPLRRELRALRGMLQDARNDATQAGIQGQLGALREMLGALGHAGTRDRQAPACPLREVLHEAGIDAPCAAAVAARARAETPAHAPWARQLESLRRALAARLQVGGDFFAATMPPRLALVGPTGVGKTTTIAKIAAHAALMHNRRVALVCLDTYRIGAVEQLRHYAHLIGVPMSVAQGLDGLQSALDAHADADLVLVDTAGRGPADDAHRDMLREAFAAADVTAHLALAAATRGAELAQVVEAHRALAPAALVMTKLDEAHALGALINAPERAGVPIALLCDGQRVPEDLAMPDADALARALTGRAARAVPPRAAPPAARAEVAP